MADIPGEDLRALLRNKFKPVAKASPATTRYEADRRSMLSETDGRRARARGVVRDAQINFKVSSETKRRIISVLWGIFIRGAARPPPLPTIIVQKQKSTGERKCSPARV